jgi:hypothetical protein
MHEGCRLAAEQTERFAALLVHGVTMPSARQGSYPTGARSQFVNAWPSRAQAPSAQHGLQDTERIWTSLPN